MKSTTYLLTLDCYRDIAPRSRHFTFSSDQPIAFNPGQFIMLCWNGNGKRVHRNYSLANQGGYDPRHPERLELAASYIKGGFASERLFSMKQGDSVEAAGPFGRLVLDNALEVKRYLLIATGTGITPYRTMLPELAKRMQRDTALEVVLLFGARYSSEFLYREEWIHFAKQYPRFSVKAYYSQEKNRSVLLDNEQTGRVTHALSSNNFNISTNDMAYLCGHPEMVDEAHCLLSNKGLARERIKQERYTSPRRSVPAS